MNTKKTNQVPLIFLSLLGVGHMPMSPGTFGSIASLPFLLILLNNFSFPLYSLIVAALCFLAISLISTHVDIPYDKKWIVIDEFIGMAITLTPLLFQNSPNPSRLLVGFLLFRFFDIKKPFFIRRIDRENTPASVVLDDVIAGTFSAVLLQIAIVLGL